MKRDLNVTVAQGKNWPLTWYWALCLRYISMPVLAIVFSFGYPSFQGQRVDPLVIFAFVVAHIAILTVASTLILPRWMDPLIPSERQEESVRGYAPQVLLGVDDIIVTSGLEDGHSESSEGFGDKKEGEDIQRSRTDSEDARITAQPNDAAVALGHRGL